MLLGINAVMEKDVVYEITVTGISDISGNMIDSPVSATFTAPDETPPRIVSVSVAADTALTVLWDEILDPVSAVAPANYSFVRNGPPEEPMTLVAADLLAGVQVRLGFAQAMEVGEAYTLFVSGVLDTAMNVMEPDTIAVFPFDSIPPALTGAVAMGLGAIDMTFDEPVDPVPAGNISCWRVYPLGQPGNLLDIDTVTLLEGNTTARLDLAEDLVPGSDYTACALEISDPAGNSIPVQCLDFTCYDVYPPEVEEIFLTDLSHVHIRFDEALDHTAADPARYLVHETGDTRVSPGSARKE